MNPLILGWPIPSVKFLLYLFPIQLLVEYWHRNTVKDNYRSTLLVEFYKGPKKGNKWLKSLHYPCWTQQGGYTDTSKVIRLRSKLTTLSNKSYESQSSSKGCDAILPPRVLYRRLQEDWARAAKECPRVLMNLRIDFWAHGPRLGPLFFINIRMCFPSFWPCILAIIVV